MSKTKSVAPTRVIEISAPRVRHLMTDSPRTCRVGESANDPARIMWEQDCGAVPVVDDAGRLVGIVTDRDICMAAYFRGAPLAAIPVASIMSTDLCTCQADDELRQAQALMRERQVNRLPVVTESGGLVGMLALCDLTQNLSRSGALRQQTGDAQYLLETVAAIREPRVVSLAS